MVEMVEITTISSRHMLFPVIPTGSQVPVPGVQREFIFNRENLLT